MIRQRREGGRVSPRSRLAVLPGKHNHMLLALRLAYLRIPGRTILLTFFIASQQVGRYLVGPRGTRTLTPLFRRTRRVNCDETKPACHRCTSTRRTCNGYDEAVTRQPQHLLTGANSIPAPPIPLTLSLSTLRRCWCEAAAASTPGLRLIRPSPPKIEGQRSRFPTSAIFSTP